MSIAKERADTAPLPPVKKRLRLSTPVRRQQILDAALVEFSALGFTAASIAKIADRAGMSKANLYVHFKSKDEIFETLLKDVLEPSKAAWQLPQPGQRIEDMIDTFIDDRYRELTPQMLSIMRLLISESHRVPELIQRWHAATMLPAHDEQQRLVDQYVASGRMEKTPLTDNFSFAMVPLLYAVVCRLIFPADLAQAECDKTKETHRQILHLLLKAKQA